MNKSPKTLQQAIQYFSDELVCIDAVARMRWIDGKIVCPHCMGIGAYWFKTQKRWKCMNCRKQFSVKVGTVFEDSPISLTKWLPCLWLLTNCKNGVSSWEIHRSLGVSQKTAWFMLQRLRLALRNEPTKLGGDSGPVEVDETFVGGQKRFMHAKRRAKYTDATVDNKAVVMGFFDRDLRRIRTTVIPNVRRDTLQDAVLAHVKKGSTVYTDNATTYVKWSQNYVHEIVNKAETYVRGQVHVNGLENFWSLVKRSLKGTYIAVEPFHLSRYLDEQIFRFENRATKDNPLNDSDRFMLALSQVSGKRLTYAELTGKNDQTTTPEPF